MKDCLETHDHPSITTEGDHPELPTRVLQVSSTSTPGTVQLYCSHPLESAPYAALSYCWGSLTQPIQLEEKTFSNLVNGLPVSEFPKTIIDAINVTRKLGLRYLWVDALCIFRDSEVDKVKEIRKMAHIYQQAYVTIAAGNAKRVQDGFLYAPADPMKNGRWIEMPFRKLGRVYGTCGMRKSLDPELEPLNQRAWTLQETLLSRRLLIFDSQIMRWQCPQHQYMEEWGESNLDIPVLRCLSSLRFEDLRREAPRYSVRHELTRWHAILGLYTARQLRYGSDKLDALSAVAQEAAKYIPSQYTAGLWSEFLEHELCWFVSSHNQHPPAEYVAPRYRGPSWSWISVDNAKIDHKTRGGSFDAEILKCEAQLVSKESPFGEVMSGRLVIRGLLARATRSNRESLRRRVPGFDYSFGINDRFWHGVFFFDRKEDDDPNRDWTNNYFLGIWEKQGLILEKMADGQFRRIGLSYWGSLRSQTRQKWNVLPESEYTIISII